MNLTRLSNSSNCSVKIAPRWPYKDVLISSAALKHLEAAQSKLEPSIKLILTRGFEPGNFMMRLLHRLCRKVGGVLFVFLYPKRAAERSQIFSSNGHDIDGTHVDISIEINGRRLAFLQRGVFSSRSEVGQSKLHNRRVLQKVYKAMKSSGFTIHRNPTESLQIHCDFRLSRDEFSEKCLKSIVRIRSSPKVKNR